MKKIKEFNKITDWDKEIIKQENRIFGESNIERMFIQFRENNFRNNPVCEIVLGN